MVHKSPTVIKCNIKVVVSQELLSLGKASWGSRAWWIDIARSPHQDLRKQGMEGEFSGDCPRSLLLPETLVVTDLSPSSPVGTVLHITGNLHMTV